MNVLSSIIPGIRELRTPLTSGLLWLGAIVVFGVTHHVVLIPSSHVEIELRHLSSIFAALLFVPAVLTGALLLGNVMIALIEPLLHMLGRWARKSIMGLFSLMARPRWTRWRKYIGRQRFRFEARTRTISNSARGLVMEADSRALAKVGVPGSAALMFPLDEVLGSLSLTAPQLSQTAQTQYQEYDRARSEAQFRVAVVPPLIALAAVLPTNSKLWILIAAIFAGLILLLQAVGQERQAMDILANAAYLGYITVPMVQSITEYLSELPNQPIEVGEWLGAIVRGLSERGYFEEQDTMMYELTELNENDFSVLREYLENNQPELAGTFDRILGLSNEEASGAADESTEASADEANSPE